ncbi:hypothetical protein SLE2022_267370 [Rubroshorea leprosula]
MTPVIPCSVNNISLFCVAADFRVRESSCLTRCSSSRKHTKFALSSQRFVAPLLTSVRLFPERYRKGYSLIKKSGIHILSATETDVTVEEPDSPVADEASPGGPEIPSDDKENGEKVVAKSESNPAPSQSKRSRTTRKSEMPPVKDEELIPGATFTGKVMSIQPFGAFVDIGAFKDGLVHVSRLSDSFVKDVGSVVSVGQEVKVRLVEVDTETGRISLSMSETDDSKRQQRKDSPATSDRIRPAKKNASKSSQKRDEVKHTKFVKGQELEGTVKNLTRSGAFISLPEGEEGFLPSSEESDDVFGNMMGGSSLQVGQEVKVCVLKIARGQVTLTMKTEKDDNLDFQVTEGVIQAATNPFVLAFRKNKDIAAFLDQRDKEEKESEKPVQLTTSEELKGQAKQGEAVSGALDVQVLPTVSDEVTASASSVTDEKLEKIEAFTGKTDEVADVVDNNDEISDEVTASASSVADGKLEKIEAFTEKTDEVADVVNNDGEISEEVTASASSIADEKLEKIEAFTEKTDEVAGVVNNDGEISDEVTASASSVADEKLEKVEAFTEKIDEVVGVVNNDGKISDEVTASASSVADEKLEKIEAFTEITDEVADVVNNDDEITEKESESSEILTSEASISTDNQMNEEAPSIDLGQSSETSISSREITDQVSLSESSISDEVQIPTVEDSMPSVAPAEGEEVGDRNGSVTSSGVQSEVPQPEDSEDVLANQVDDTKAADDQIKSLGSQDIDEVMENQVDDTKDEVQTENPASESESGTPVTSQLEKAESANQESGTITNSNGSNPKENVPKAGAISPALVKQLREETGAGMMDCKKALSETGGDIVKAQEFLRKKGLASAEKKASRVTAEGRIGSYIHDSRIGVLVEVNCETDFVSRGDIFKELVEDLSMQVAACPQVQYLVTEDVPEEIVNKEREIEMQKEDLLSKPEQIRSKIVEGRIRKRLEELALLEQPYIKNDKLVVKDWVKQTIATIGENIKVKRFVRYNLGEGLQKKSQDFAAEVAAQTAAKSAPTSVKEQPAPVEAKETVQKPPAATVSAALVKQLREETGAGMMDCKKALTETGGDLEKAQEYLRKKGLSTADKKSSRLAAEGRIGSYIHDSRIGVLIEVNCETDFVGRSEKFKELVDDLAMQVVACPQVQFVSIEDIPESIVNKEKELEMQREDLSSKPENIRERIVEGRVSKRLGELALIEQPFIKDDSVLVKDLVKQTVAALGENIKVRRFVRFTLGETNEDAKTGSKA